MKELVLVFPNMREAEYHFRNLKNGEIKIANISYIYKNCITFDYYDNSNFNFIQKLLGKKELKQLIVFFKSKNSNLKGFKNIKNVDKNLETFEVYEIIKKEM